MADDASVSEVLIHRRRVGGDSVCRDWLAVEAPLAISVDHPELPAAQTLTLTLRTPGEDAELALGWLHAEGLFEDGSIFTGMRTLGADHVRVELAGAPPDLSRLARSGPLHGGCGVCGKLKPDSLWRTPAAPVEGVMVVDDAILRGLPAALRSAQRDYAQTGGVHAVALFEATGRLLALREDIGRHNALDKLVGAARMAQTLPWRDHLLLLSGRASAELIHKAWRAGASLVAAIGAPSSLALSMARQAGITLVGFLHAEGYNVYTHPERIR